MDESARTFGTIRHVTLIGGGDLMLSTARAARARTLGVSVVLAPRFVNEALPIDGRLTRVAFETEGFEVHVSDDINAKGGVLPHATDGPGSLALCFGPAWIFSDAVIERFSLGMHNFNGIPTPRYLGAAHYTWQILNQSLEGGCTLQEITSVLDRGPILRHERFVHPPETRTPWDYFVSNYSRGTRFIEKLLDDMKADVRFVRAPWSDVDAERLYFPRLHTMTHGYVDWSWDVSEVERFFCAFDRPYPGAATYLDEMLIRVRDVRREVGDMMTHPFCAGLIVRRARDHVVVAARGGLLRIGEARYADGSDALGALREGRRLHTPAKSLENARTSRPRLGAHGFESRES